MVKIITCKMEPDVSKVFYVISTLIAKGCYVRNNQAAAAKYRAANDTRQPCASSPKTKAQSLCITRKPETLHFRHSSKFWNANHFKVSLTGTVTGKAG